MRHPTAEALIDRAFRLRADPRHSAEAERQAERAIQRLVIHRLERLLTLSAKAHRKEGRHHAS